MAFILPASVIAQNVGIANTSITPDAQAIMELRATDKGVLLPRMTTAQATSLAASLDAADDGMTVYDTDENRYKYWDGSTLTWRTIASGTATSGDFIMNGSTQQTAANFNIDGNGTMSDLNLTGNDIVSTGHLRITAESGVRIRLDSDANANDEFQITDNGGTTPVFSVTETGDITANSLGGAGNAVVTTDNTGVLSKTALTGNTNDVYIGTGAFVDASTLGVTGDNLGNHSATTNLNMNNFNANQVNAISIADPGDQEGIVWSGSAAKIFVSPLDGGNTDGYLRLINDGGIVFEPGSEDTETVTFSSNGTVGIGTTSPSEDLHVYRADTDVARVYATGSSQGSGMFYAGQSSSYGGGFVYDGDGAPALVGGTDRITFFRRDNNADNDVMSFAYNSNTVRMTALAGGAGGVVTADNEGDLGRTTFTGNANHVMNGNGAFVDASSLSVSGDNLGSHVATSNLNMGNREVDNINYLDMRAGNGFGLRFWSSDSYAINMGNAAEYQYGYVNDYSIKTNMSNTAGRGWTWGVDGVTPVASIEAQSGHMTLKGNLHVSQGNTTGNGIILGDDGGIYDRNDGYGSLAFSAGVDLEDAQDVTDHLQVRFNDSYPEIWSYRNNSTTLTEFRTGIYNNGGTFYSQNQMYARAGIANDAGTLVFNDNIQITGGSPAAGRVLQSDASGNATWVDATTLNVTGDNLGNHTATANLRRTGHNIGHLEGSYNNVGANSSFSNPIYTIGAAYNPAVSTLSNMYGIGYSHANFWGTGGNRPGGWGMYAAADGDIRVILDASNGIVWSEGVMSTNSGYQVDGLTVIDDGGGWHRSYGNTGWYNGTHGGGFYMTDATWIRTYNNKSFYHNTGTMRTDGTFQVGGSGATLNVPNNGNFSYRTNVLFANTAGNVGVGSNSPGYRFHVNGNAGLGQTYLLNSDIYFNNTSHSHTGIGNTAGYAAIENASNYNTLMILGRANGIGGVRSVSIWDRLDVNGDLTTTGAVRIGDQTTDAHRWWGIMQAGSTSDSHQLLPNASNWSRVGRSDLYFWYGYAGSWNSVSQRKLKRDITPLTENESLYEHVMHDIDNIKPSFYKFKVETDEMEEGNEVKYRAAMRLGLILDETPDYVQDHAFSAIDGYSLATLAVAAAKYNRDEIKELKSGKGATQISDFGSNRIEGEMIWVSFDTEFSSQLTEGEVPVVTVTPNELGAEMAVIEKTREGFRVRKVGTNPLNFDWMAMAKLNQQERKNRSPETISPELMDQIIVDESKKAQIRAYYEKENRELKEYNERLDAKEAEMKTNGEAVGNP